MRHTVKSLTEVLKRFDEWRKKAARRINKQDTKIKELEARIAKLERRSH